ncbi:MAG TPA: DUF2085 domain-containing protein [Pyrinomonadaceae bacterium]|nr:DUF2085 domain-containing protein [Pyrinomonadaceae bacterium]
MVTEAQSISNNRTRRIEVPLTVWAIVSTVSLAIVALVVATPLAEAAGHSSFASAIYTTFSYLCHQIPERSFHLGAHQFAVCSRCTGLYAGFALVTLGYPLLRSLKRTDTPRIIWLLLAVVPLAVDFALGYFSIWENNHFTRVTTGALLGGVAALYVVPGLIDLSLKIRRRKTAPPVPSQVV